MCRYSPAFTMRRFMVLLVLSLAGVLPASSSTAQCGDIVFSHLAPPTAAAGLDLPISGLISGLDEGESILILHRGIDAGDFETIETWIHGGLFEAVLPAAVVVPPGIEYYLTVTSESGELCSHPEGAPIIQTFTVTVDTVDGGDSGGAGSPPIITQLAPDAGYPLAAADLVFVLGIHDPDGDLDPAGISLLVNGRDRSHEAAIRAEVLTWVPASDTPAGPIELSCEAVDLAGNRTMLRTTVLLTGAVSTETIRETDRDRAGRPSGRISAHSLFTDLEGDGAENRQEPVRVIDGRLSARGQLGFVDYRAKAFLTSDDRSEVQPRSRFLLSLIAGPLTTKLGDVNPRFSPLMIWGRRVRGVELNVDTRPFQAQVVYGFTARAVEGAGHDSLDIAAPDGVRKVIDQAGTYQRKLMGLRMGFGSGRVMGFGLELLKIKDEVDSIDYGLRPKDNIILGSDLKVRLFDRRFQLNAAAALSMLTDDITGGVLTKAEADSTFGITLPFDPEEFENVLVINSSTTPMDFSGSPNLAVQGTARADFSGNRLELRYRRIGESYYSLATTTLPQDYQGIRIRDAITMPDRGLRLSAEFETYHDNLAGDSEHTLTTRVYGGNIFFRPRGAGGITRLNTGLRLLEQGNGDSTESEGVQNQTLYLSLGGGLHFPIRRFSQQLNLNTHTSHRRDDISESGETRGLNLFLESRTRFPDRPLTLGLLAGRTTNRYPGLAGTDGTLGLDANFTTLQASISYFASKLPLRLSWRQVNGDGNMSGASSSRSTFNLSAEYRLDLGVAITGRVGHARFDDESDANLDYDEAYLGLGLEQRF